MFSGKESYSVIGISILNFLLSIDESVSGIVAHLERDRSMTEPFNYT